MKIYNKNDAEYLKNLIFNKEIIMMSIIIMLEIDIKFRKGKKYED